MINWEKLTRGDMNLINHVTDRAVNMFPQLDRLSIHMDVSAVHISGCKLDLQKLLKFDDFNFAHDIAGIRSHINRQTGELQDCFVPRCS